MSGDGFNASVTSSVEMEYTLVPGQTGYLNVTVKGVCYSGTVGECTGGSCLVEDGTGVEICAPTWTFNGVDGQDNGVPESEDEDAVHGLMAGKNVGLAILVAFGGCFGG
ncbi:hypothetical protein BJX65DRAFT_312669 [Aspergillus insuetus]